MTQSKKIAVTGGIGSGKSYVCGLIAQRGYPVFSCDEINRALWSDEAYCKELADRFPACTVGGEIDKTLLAKAVFSDEAALRALNEIAHPRIMRALVDQMERAGGVCFAEVPLLFEGGYETLFDDVIAVRRERAARIQAVAARDGLSEDAITLRMAQQFPPEQLERKHCYILENCGTEEEIAAKLDRILQKIGI